MKRLYLTFIPLFIVALLLLGCNKNINLKPVYEDVEVPEAEIQQKSISILNMSDLEIIKKSADFLKSCGKTLTFEETRIVYENNINTDILCKNQDNLDVHYKGEYLAIYFYPHAKYRNRRTFWLYILDKTARCWGIGKNQTLKWKRRSKTAPVKSYLNLLLIQYLSYSLHGLLIQGFAGCFYIFFDLFRPGSTDDYAAYFRMC